MVVATIEQISEVRAHPNADLLELATIKGWQVCVKKNEFKVNDLCAFITVDSIFDPHPSVEFLRNKGFRIKSCRLRGELSQGIAFPISFLIDRGISDLPDIGQDISSLIGCKHYEKPVPVCLMGIALGNFPTFLRKTDEDNIKNYPLIIDELRGRKYYISVKLDGCSGTFYVKEDHFGVCSRNLELTDTQENSFWKIARKYQVESELRRIFPNRIEHYRLPEGGSCFPKDFDGLVL
jgi:RNA ligase (TIGR02306 family)